METLPHFKEYMNWLHFVKTCSIIVKRWYENPSSKTETELLKNDCSRKFSSCDWKLHQNFPLPLQTNLIAQNSNEINTDP